VEADSVMLQRAVTDVWSTPQWLFDALNKEFGFTLDPCTDGTNAKCDKFYTTAENGLLRDWGTETVFMNPPYSEIAEWMRKAYGAAQEGATVVCLIPARTDTSWWHRYCMKSEIRLLRGRLKFGDSDNSAPFPSAIIVFRPREFRLVSGFASDTAAEPKR
jgi:phage N-6-adenine-methyltransferase